MPSGQNMIARQEALYTRYCELRGVGQYPADAAREAGISASTAIRYERSYKKLRGLPLGRRSASWSER